MRHRGSTMETKLIKYEDLGAANHDWLNAHYHFHLGVTMTKIEWVFGSLRVINDDIIEPNTGFACIPIRTWK